MPPTHSRHSRPPSPPSPTLTHPATTPVRPYVRRPSVSSYSPTVTSSGQQAPKVNITRLAIEGRARQNHDGAYVKMYLKLSLPLDSVAPGSTVPLFPEENVKVLQSQVHPLDNNSVPYNFSSSSSPLLHNAARALHLPPRSAESFHAAFGIQTGSVSSSSPSSRTLSGEASRESVTPVDPHYAGHILVSNYAISYVLPKAFLTRNRSTADVDTGSQSSLRSRRGSIGERNALQFMAAIDMWIPYVSKPPRSPYLLSIPTPRCLHNHIKLRIFPPSPAASSLASLSSVEDDGWDVASDPHVSRVASNRLTRQRSYSHFADDESSDSSQTTSSDGCSVQGTFPSAERIRLRWAKPMKVVDVPDGGDGRRRVGVREVKGDMTCVIQAKYRDSAKNVEAVVMHVEYKGTCKGIWFPGVATLLGLDVGLEAKNSDVLWVPGTSPTWEVEGSPGYSGFDIGRGPLLSQDSRASSFDSTISQVTPSPVEFPGYDTQMNAHHDLSTPSLLHAPLPNSNVGEYSFDSSTGENASAEWTSPASSALQASTDASRPPGTPITLHLNMNELLPPVQNIFTFTISGTILVTPRMTLARASRQGLGANSQSDFDDGAESEPVVLPRFTVLAADAETTSIVVRNEVESMCVVEVYNATGDLKDAQIRKTVLQKGGFTKCSDDGGRIVLKNIRQQSPIPFESHPRTPNGHIFSRLSAAGSPLRTASPLRFKKDGPVLIPAVENRVTLFGAGTKESPLCYAVRCTLNVSPNPESEWLEFGLGLPRVRKTKTKASISIINASVEGAPVRFEITSAGTSDRTVASGVSPAFDQVGSVEWAAWAKVHVGTLGGAHIVVDYLVKRERETGSIKTGQHEAVLLPTFALPVGRLDGRIITHPDLCIANLKTNFAVEHCGEAKCKFSHFSAAEYFVPQISMTVKSKAKSRTKFLMSALLQVIPWLVLFAAILHVKRATAPFREPSHLPAVSSAQTIALTTTTEYITIEPITITSTVYTTVTSTSTLRPMATSSIESPTPTRSASNPKPTETLKYVPPNDSTALSPTSPAVWTIQWPVEDVQVAVVVDKLCDAAEIVWQMLRRAYHYPLDPP